MAFNYYPLSVTDTEIDLRNEFNRILNGDPDFPGMIPHGVWIIVRKLRRDSNGQPISGSEVDPITKEPDMVFKSDRVTKTGYVYDDHITKGHLLEIRLSSLTEYQTKPGIVNDSIRVLYVDYKANPEVHDLVIVPKVYEDGSLVTPIKIEKEFYITNVLPQQLDSSRVEFYRCILEHQR